MNPNDDRHHAWSAPPPTDAFLPAPDADPSAGPSGHRSRRRGPRPVPPGVEYHRMLAGDKRRVLRGVLAIVLLLVGLFAISYAFAEASAFVDGQMGRTNPAAGGTDYTPVYHASGMLGLAMLIPLSMLIQRLLYGVRGASQHSVLSRFRFGVLGRALLFIGPFWLIAVTVMNVWTPPVQKDWPLADLVAMFVLTLLLVPLQAAGEEYGLRGLAFQVAGSWSRGPRVGLVLAVVVSSLLFTTIHGAGDPWINIWYFLLSLSLAVITWRTGGIEIPIVIHGLLNTLTFLICIVLQIDLGASVMDRSAGTGSPIMLVPAVTAVVIALVVFLRTRRTGPALTPGPLRTQPDTRPARVQPDARPGWVPTVR
ncbi:CPBP family intramembrane glutamic endopeptidase [Nocardiopsis dassonvillei]|uniref:CPBP family intramembrane glutamic endopeptidase n=1 Tax=Nocardiopsis dassonvillei TaxID=2014 RepID=UPI0033F20353